MTVTAGLSRTHFDFKSASLPVVALVLKTTDLAVLATELAQRLADAPGFFDQDPVLIDLAGVRDAQEPLDFAALVQLLRQHRTLPVAVRGGSDAQMQAAREAGLAAAPDAAPTRAEAEPREVVREVEVIREVEVVREVPVAALPAVVVDKPLRSGQQVYARGADLIVMAMRHQVKLIAPQFVKPYVKGNKNDANDAEAICEAVSRPNMRFVPVKTVEQQNIQARHRVRQELVHQRTAKVN